MTRTLEEIIFGELVYDKNKCKIFKQDADVNGKYYYSVYHNDKFICTCNNRQIAGAIVGWLRKSDRVTTETCTDCGYNGVCKKLKGESCKSALARTSSHRAMLVEAIRWQTALNTLIATESKRKDKESIDVVYSYRIAQIIDSLRNTVEGDDQK